MYPTLFISHGAPNIVLTDSLTKKNINEFSKSLEKPKYIIIFSAHYVTKKLNIINYETNGLMYDFYGFEKDLYNFRYEINSDKGITLEILEHLKNNNIDISIDKKRTTYDHGVWTALSMMFEEQNIPVIQISIPYSFTFSELLNLGKVLQRFKDDAMVISSGALTHNLSQMKNTSDINKKTLDFVLQIKDVISKGKEKELIELTKEKNFLEQHPTNEHFLPLIIALGNAINKNGISFNSEIVYSNQSMECFVFDKN